MEWRAKIQGYYQKSLLLLGQCDLCGNSTDKHLLLCSSCLNELPLFKLEMIQNDLLNWPAINSALPNVTFDQLFCLSPYLPPFNHWLTEFKYQGRFELANLFADLLEKQWRMSSLSHTLPKVDLILSVPLHLDKWQKRGYNQAHLIAKRFANKVNLPYQANAIERIKKNTSQVGKTGKQRRKSLAGAFRLNSYLPSSLKHIVLIDDVVTTGSTASEISKLLKLSGIDKITLISVCLTLPKT